MSAQKVETRQRGLLIWVMAMCWHALRHKMPTAMSQHLPAFSAAMHSSATSTRLCSVCLPYCSGRLRQSVCLGTSQTALQCSATFAQDLH